MRIAYLINGLNGGGAAFPMTQVIGLMRELGHEVTVFALMQQDGKAAQRLKRDNIPCELIGQGVYDFVAPAVRLVRRLRRMQPDLLWTSLTRGTIYGQLMGHLLDIPVVSWQHSAFLKPGNVAMLRRLARFTSLWVADSEAVSAFAQTTLGLDAKRVRVWTPFVATAQVAACNHWDGRGPLRLGSLGRLHVSKQFSVLVRAFARMRELDPRLAANVELYVGGDGPEEADLKALVRRLDLEHSVRFVGFVQQPATFLSSLHGYVQTSLKEGFCIAAHEAMQAGLPVIATRVGELAYSVKPADTGWLCDVGDVEALARAMIELASDPTAAASMGRRAREWVLRRYSPERFRGTGERLLDEVQCALGAAREEAPSTSFMR